MIISKIIFIILIFICALLTIPAYSQDEDEEGYEYNEEDEFIVGMSDDLKDPFSAEDISDKPAENYINYLIASINSDLKFPIEEDKGDEHAEIEAKFIESERKRLKKERKKKNRSYSDYTPEEKEELNERLNDFLKELKASTYDDDSFTEEDYFIKAIESPVNVKRFVAKKGGILPVNDPKLKKSLYKYISDKVIKVTGNDPDLGDNKEDKKKHKRVVEYLIKKMGANHKVLEENFVIEERKIRLKNIEKKNLKSKYRTPKQYSKKEKLEIRERWSALKNQFLMAGKEGFKMDLSDNLEAAEYLSVQPNAQFSIEKSWKTNKRVIDYLIEVIEETPNYLATENFRDTIPELEEFKEFENIENEFIEKERSKRRIYKNRKPRLLSEYTQKEKDKLMNDLDFFHRYHPLKDEL